MIMESDKGPSDRKSREPNVRYSEAATLSTEQVASDKQAASGDNFPHCSMCPEGLRCRCGVYHSAYTRVPVLARLHRLDTRKLDVDIQRTEDVSRVEPAAFEGGPSDHPP